MNTLVLSKEADTDLSQSMVDEHRFLEEQIDAASHEIEKFFAARAGQASSDVSRIIDLLEQLRDLAQAHFQHEEALMTKNNFPEAVSHKRDHDYLLRSLIHFTSSLSHGTVSFSPDIGVNLRSWLTYHIKKYDKAYVSFIEAGALKAQD